MAEGFDDYEMGDIGNKYSTYDNYTLDELYERRDDLIDEKAKIDNGSTIHSSLFDYDKFNEDYEEEMKYIEDRIIEKGGEIQETSYIDSPDGKTVDITKGDTTVTVNKTVNFFDGGETSGLNTEDKVYDENSKLNTFTRSELEKNILDLRLRKNLLEKTANKDSNILNSISKIDEKISALDKELEGRKKAINLVKKFLNTEDDFDEYDEETRDFLDRINLSKNGDVKYSSKGPRAVYKEYKIVLVDVDNKLKINRLKSNKTEVEQFEEKLKKLKTITKEREKTRAEMPMVEIGDNDNYTDIPGLTSEENRVMRGVLNPNDNMDPRSRIGSEGALQIQADEFQRVINETIEERDNYEGNDEGRELLDGRIAALNNAMDRTLEQRQNEEARYAQEEDISRLQKFKEWAKDNLAGLSALAISIAGIITTILVAGRTVIMKGAQATSKFAKAVAEIGKKLWPFIAPLLSILSTVLSWGAKGLAWLAQNLWVLAIAAVWFIYDQYKERSRRKKTS